MWILSEILGEGVEEFVNVQIQKPRGGNLRVSPILSQKLSIYQTLVLKKSTPKNSKKNKLVPKLLEKKLKLNSSLGFNSSVVREGFMGIKNPF